MYRRQHRALPRLFDASGLLVLLLVVFFDSTHIYNDLEARAVPLTACSQVKTSRLFDEASIDKGMDRELSHTM